MFGSIDNKGTLQEKLKEPRQDRLTLSTVKSKKTDLARAEGQERCKQLDELEKKA